MRLDKIIQRRFRRSGAGVNVAGDVNAVVAGERSGTSRSRIVSRQRIVQRSSKKRG